MTMQDSEHVHVYGSDGVLGRVVETDPGAEQTLIELEGGDRMRIPTALLSRRSDGSYALPYSRSELRGGELELNGQRVVIPVVAEELQVGRRTVETGRVRVRKLVQEHVEQVDEPLLREEVQVERVAINQLIDQAPAVRDEGDVLIVPVVEEVLVVEKRLMLREELRISKRRISTNESQEVVLRREEVVVERLAPDEDASAQR